MLLVALPTYSEESANQMMKEKFLIDQLIYNKCKSCGPDWKTTNTH